jgi:hypothetical protein
MPTWLRLRNNELGSEELFEHCKTSARWNLKRRADRLQTKLSAVEALTRAALAPRGPAEHGYAAGPLSSSPEQHGLPGRRGRRLDQVAVWIWFTPKARLDLSQAVGMLAGVGANRLIEPGTETPG